ncbi:MAG: hypothetical protein G01um101416_960 [Microgenomates group bacterium Gr01-1014_16]|nr:MAG: hypothetical protein G01um101416_960 [Microgenomates group bacterium Gr01-1014_16]
MPLKCSSLFGPGEDAEAEGSEVFVVGGENSCHAEVFGEDAGCSIG